MMGECEEKSDLLKDRLSFSSLFFCLVQHNSVGLVTSSPVGLYCVTFLSTDLPADCFVSGLDMGFAQGLSTRLKSISGKTVSSPS